MKTLPAVHVVIVGGGWTGLLMAKELGSNSALSIVVLERGGSPKAEEYVAGMDELDFAIRGHMMQDLSQETVTVRHTLSDRAVPMRQYGSFLPGTGVGGAGEHWGGQCNRFTPDCFEILTRTIGRYGPKRLPEGHSIQDWGVTYDEMESYYTRAELMLGVSGKAGNIRGKKMEGGDPFEGWRSSEYPTPPLKLNDYPRMFGSAAKSLGYHPFPVAACTTSEAYTNPDDVSRTGCMYCGFCVFYGCMVGAKAQPSNTLLPVIENRKNVSIRSGAAVQRIIHQTTEKESRARGVVYIDVRSGEKVFQPAELVFLASFTINNNRLLLLSKIGEPYNVASGTGNLGRNLTHQVLFEAARLFFDKPLNSFMGSGGSGVRMNDLNGDVLDHTDLPFLRGGGLMCQSMGNSPISGFGHVPESSKPRWGSEWKKDAIYYYDRTGTIHFEGEHLAYKTNYMDLDPTYTDRFGDPLLRLTIDWQENERRMVTFMTEKAVEIARAMGAKQVTAFPSLGHYDATRLQSTHIQGGAIMGASPEHSVVNPYLQHWQVSNLFVLGGSSFPQPGILPTLTMLAQTYRTADIVARKYLKSPGSLM
jgi:gluconate 2-dehydrogenase alpha chain